MGLFQDPGERLPHGTVTLNMQEDIHLSPGLSPLQALTIRPGVAV